jgi:photosystem II stability/assembly factor-like uncharacterized protein
LVPNALVSKGQSIYIFGNEVMIDDYNNQRLAITTDNGDTWSYRNYPGNSVYFNHVYFLTSKIGWGITTTPRSELWKTTNGGEEWFQVHTFTAPLDMVGNNSIQFIDSFTGYICNNYYLYKTTDGGYTFNQSQPNPYSKPISCLYFFNDSTGWIGGLEYLGFTNTGADSIIQITNDYSNYSNYFSSIDFINDSIGFAAGSFDNGNLIKTTNGGNSWDYIPTPVASKNKIGLFRIVDENHLFGIMGGYLTTIVFSSNGGNNWIERNIPPNNFIYDFKMVNNDTGWVVGPGCVFRYPSRHAPMLAPVLTFPENNDIGVEVPFNFKWRTTNFTSVYYIQISSDSNFSENVYGDVYLIDSTYNSVKASLMRDTIYYWRVFAYNDTITSEWSSVWKFKISGVVPVKMVNFEAKIVNNAVVLNWQTEYETNSDKFEIERSIYTQAGYGNYSKINELPAKGNSDEIQNYGPFEDRDLVQGGKYKYRIKEIDKAGDCQFSNESEVIIDQSSVEVPIDPYIGNYLYLNGPNPASENTEIGYHTNTQGHLTLELIDILGNKLMDIADKYLSYSEENRIMINILGLSDGYYFIVMKFNQYSYVQKLSIVH